MQCINVTNCVYVTATVATETWNLSTCTSVTIQDLGTELDTREHGCGGYATEEKTRLVWENRSIESHKSYADRVDRNTTVKMDENGS